MVSAGRPRCTSGQIQLELLPGCCNKTWEVRNFWCKVNFSSTIWIGKEPALSKNISRLKTSLRHVLIFISEIMEHGAWFFTLLILEISISLQAGSFLSSGERYILNGMWRRYESKRSWRHLMYCKLGIFVALHQIPQIWTSISRRDVCGEMRHAWVLYFVKVPT